jgi:PPM family protein phosphatase
VIGHVGDSRAYQYHAGALRQLTRDHTVTEDAVRAGLLSETEALHHPHRHILSRAIGPEPNVRPDVVSCRLLAGDMILLCTDGLTKMLDDRNITEILAAGWSDGPSRCAALIDEANRRGGDDNTTVVVISAD